VRGAERKWEREGLQRVESERGMEVRDEASEAMRERERERENGIRQLLRALEGVWVGEKWRGEEGGDEAETAIKY
jgi:hypothetical protein